MILAAFLVVLGLALLAFGADRLVLAAIRLARVWGMSPVVIGALVVGLGTSAPELLVSSAAALDGNLDLAMANAIGSNVTNVTLVLGVTALVRPIHTHLRLLRREGITMLVASVVLAGFGLDAHYGRLEGGGLLLGFCIACWLLVRWARRDEEGQRVFAEEVDAALGEEQVSVVREMLMGTLAIVVLGMGAESLVRGATTMAELLGLSSAVIGMTVIAVGTSLPELAASVAGARRNEHDIVVGNILGSNLFNALAVAGLAATAAPGVVQPDLLTGSAWMVGSAAFAGLFAATGRRLSRWEGAVLLTAFIAFSVLIL